MESFPPFEGEESSPAWINRQLEWRTRYDGLVSVAYLGGKAVAGISGPWSGKFALTWWERDLPKRQQLELHDSMASAQQKVETWAGGVRTQGQVVPLPVVGSSTRAANADTHRAPGLLDKLRSLVQLPVSSGEKIDRLRRASTSVDADLSDLHFAALD